jgi:hypothetical protein
MKLHRGQLDRNNIRTIKRKKANWIVHTLFKNCILNMLLKERWDRSDRKTRKKK